MSEQTTDVVPLTEGERTPLRYADKTIRNAHKLTADQAPLRIAPGDWTTVEHYVERIVAARVAAARADERERITAAFGDWAMKNEIAAPPLDWAWFGEIMRRYSPLHEGDSR